jgi:hypothetical protein
MSVDGLFNRRSSNSLREKHDVRHAINELHNPPADPNTEQTKRLYAHGYRRRSQAG